ncbi:MAG: diaminopimelate decarboxylase [Dehalococcoidales bacterium]|jgi:diaminopimelate decarboxylase|nr:diaminopimelate decarboxylase [Dehalococcoidales bacterium]
MESKLVLFPSTAGVNNKGHLLLGGCDTVGLAAEFGTPLYVFDELGIRRRCAEFRQEFSQRYADSAVFYSAKAFINKALAQLFNEEGLGLDVVSAGEMSVVRSAGFPMDRVYFPGNNKSAEELKLALEWGVGRIVVDNFHELAMLNEIAGERGDNPDILLRLSPGVDPHTHRYIITGNLDSKFGVPMVHGEKALATILSMPRLKLRGLHFHIGSQIPEFEPYQQAIDIILGFAAEMKKKHGFEVEELSIGGGFAVQYTLDSPAPPVADYAEAMTSGIINGCQKLGLVQPRLIIEPGRSVVGQSGVALYTVGVIKDIPGVRRYVSVDGGMADNIRPALYGARHEAVVANRMAEKETDKVTIAGKFCESGDIIIKDVMLPPLAAGDILAVADCGAYCLPLASNYNASLKPAVVLVKEGKARLIRRRETFEDLTRGDLV